MVSFRENVLGTQWHNTADCPERNKRAFYIQLFSQALCLAPSKKVQRLPRLFDSAPPNPLNNAKKLLSVSPLPLSFGAPEEFETPLDFSSVVPFLPY